MINYKKLLNKISIDELNNIISKSAIKTIVDGRYIRMSTLEKICKYLKCQPDDIIKFK